jgi:hypothetical protein
MPRDMARACPTLTGKPPASLLLVHGAGSGPWIYRDWAGGSRE